MSLAPKDDADAAAQKKPKRTEDEVLASYMRNDDLPSSSGGGFGNGAMLRGVLMMVGAVVWFVAGLSFGIIFFYPPILLVLGMLEFGRGVAFGD